jgi:hypothetical protein
MIFWLVLEIEISHKVIISWRISFRRFFEDYIFTWWNIWVFIFFICLKILFNVNGKATVWHTRCCNMGRSPYMALPCHRWNRKYWAKVVNTWHQGWSFSMVLSLAVADQLWEMITRFGGCGFLSVWADRYCSWANSDCGWSIGGTNR